MLRLPLSFCFVVCLVTARPNVERDSWGNISPSEFNTPNSVLPSEFKSTNYGIPSELKMSNIEESELNVQSSDLPSELNVPNTDFPSELNIQSSDLPSELNVPNTDLPSELNVPKSDLPSELNVPNTDLPSELNVPKSDLPSELNVPNTDLPSELNVPNTELPSELNVPNTDLPSELNAPNNDLPSELNVPNTDLPSELNVPNTDLPSELNEQRNDTPLDVQISTDIQLLAQNLTDSSLLKDDRLSTSKFPSDDWLPVLNVPNMGSPSETVILNDAFSSDIKTVSDTSKDKLLPAIGEPMDIRLLDIRTTTEVLPPEKDVPDKVSPTRANTPKDTSTSNDGGSYTTQQLSSKALHGVTLPDINETTASSPSKNTDQIDSNNDVSSMKRTVILIKKNTLFKEELFIRGGVGGHKGCRPEDPPLEDPCAISIRHNDADADGDLYLTWGGAKQTQSKHAMGTPAQWTSDDISHPYHHSLNTFGEHYWVVDFNMDCSNLDDGLFEFKAMMNDGEWERNIQNLGRCAGAGAVDPGFESLNHIARCGYLNKFEWNKSNCLIEPLED